ncbi:hypothetical protein Tco_0770334 [Tanacetum coccineum]|uniref:Uncharacterized protein n=1 Tax=Tanacetum coccineum TaxID=301880 RepID=A0ABQ4ZFT9_9ASTR
MLRTCYGHGLTKGTIIQLFYHGLDDPTQGILDARGNFLYNTPNEAFQIHEDKVLLKLYFSGEFQISPKTVVSVGGSNIDSYHAMLVDKLEVLATTIDSEFLIIRKELKEMRDGHRDNHASQIYMKDDTPMYEPHEANYVQRYHEGYHDHEPINSYSYPNHNPNNHYSYPRNQMPHPSRYFEFTKTSTEEMMREWMASQTKVNELFLAYQNPPSTTNTKSRHEIIYNIPSIRNDNDKDDVKFIKEEETEPNPTMLTPNLIMSNSPTVSPFLKDCTVHILYTQEKVFEHNETSNHVDDKELISFVGIENEVSKGNIEDTENPKRPNVSPSLVMVKKDAWRYFSLYSRTELCFYMVCLRASGKFSLPCSEARAELIRVGEFDNASY